MPRAWGARRERPHLIQAPLFLPRVGRAEVRLRGANAVRFPDSFVKLVGTNGSGRLQRKSLRTSFNVQDEVPFER